MEFQVITNSFFTPQVVGKTTKDSIEAHQDHTDLNRVPKAGTQMYNVLRQGLLECHKAPGQMLLHNGLIKVDTLLINSRLIHISR